MLKKLRSFEDVFNKLKYIMDDKQWKMCWFVILITVIGATFETLGLSMMLPFIEALMSMDTFMKSWYASVFVNVFNIESPYTIIVILGILIILIYLIKNIYLLWMSKVQIKFRCETMKALSVKIFSSYMKRPYSFFVENNSAEFMRGINDDVVGVFHVLNFLFGIIQNLFTGAFIGVFIIVTDPITSGAILGLAGGAILIIESICGKKLKFLRVKLREANKEQYNSAYQAVSGIKDIKIMQRSEYFIERYERAYSEKIKADYGYCFIESVPRRIIESVCIIGLFVVLFWRMALGVDMAIFIPTLATFAVAVFRIMPVVSGFSASLNGLIYKKNSLDATYDNIKEVEYYKQIERCKEINEEKYDKRAFRDSIEIENLLWKYDTSNKIILDDINLKIKKGESVALIGASGSGKTTLADIILGLFEPNIGHVSVDGEDINNIKKQWSQMVGCVSQTVYLIDDTIRNNIIFGYDKPLTDEEVWGALELAQLKEYVQGLPQQLDTRVGERGVMLSGGQRQRIAIARALIYNPDIIVLDEATSALDNETEKAVMEAIEKLHGTKTLVIVAHRLSTIEKCDKVYEISEGKMIQRR